MGFLIFVGIVVLIVVLLSKNKSGSADAGLPSGAWRQQYDAGWAGFIASYRQDAKSKAERQLIDKMLGDLSAQGFPISPELLAGQAAPLGPPPVQDESAVAAPDVAAMPASAAAVPQQSPSTKIDNVSMLLYFGAFLFVASVGLFVAFGGFPGIARTFAVALVAVVMYGGGVWIYRNRSHLELAGLAFAGIGIATAPFVGLAAYGFVFNHTSGAAIWLVTSLACLGMYLHALLTLKKPLLNYILIFTFLSLVLSGISVADAPIYYFGWGLAAVGILLAVLGRNGRFDKAFQDASSSSAQVFLPLAVLTSLLMMGTQGTGQLGVSLVLAAVYYAVEFKYGAAKARHEYAVASQAAATFAVGAIAYSIWSEFWAGALALAAFNLLQVIYIFGKSRGTEIWTNFASIVLGSGVMAAFLGVQKPVVLAACVVALVLSSVVVWLKQHRLDGYGLGVVAWMALPLVVGQLCLEPNLTAAGQAYLSLAALFVQYLFVFGRRQAAEIGWKIVAKVMYVLSAALVIAIAYMALPAVAMGVSLVIAASLVLLAEHHRDPDWASAAGFAAAVPVLRTLHLEGWLASSIFIALVIDIVLALRYRQEAVRWLGSLLWLALPLSLGTGVFGQWSPAQFGWAYTVVFVGFVFARAIATGTLFVSAKAPLASYAKTASLSYVVGYWLAAMTAVLVSLFSDESQLHTSLLLAVFILAVWLLAVKVERQASLYVLLPILAQALLLSVMRPDTSSASFDVYLLASTVLAAMGYLALLDRKDDPAKLTPAAALRTGSLWMAAISPVSFIFAGETHMMMPGGLLVFTGLLYHRMHNTSQKNREWIGALGLAAVWWLMWFAGVRNAQAYTHVLAALFAAYAYWRHYRQEVTVSDQYLRAMLVTATVPLVLQALGGTAGSVYGWWLLLEQIFFMLLGMSIGKPFVTRWGLYVAVGAVIYQLRHLGWAALTVLALFLIGLAVYRLQKQEKKK